MAYISKTNIMAAYRKLSKMFSNPDAQGATQKVSAIRYFVALDRFYKLHDMPCDTRNKQDKDEFASLVGLTSDVCLDLYTANFYYPLKKHSGDYCVGSNFYSAGQVNSSLVNQQEIFDYPKRGGVPLFNVQNGKLIRDITLYKNFRNYIPSADYAVALMLWLIRKTNVNIDSKNTIYENVRNTLTNIFTSEFVSVLFDDYPNGEEILNEYNLTFNDNFYSIRDSDIKALFDESIKEMYALRSSHQIIFYGAPGTGKSHGIKKRLTDVAKENIIRTTFHPDSDYSTFVGAYKPTMRERYRYEAKQRVCYPEDDDKAKARKGEPIVERVIEYDFVPQAFVNAYVRAYQTDENVYLIIEEINRGNCTQIFGDLFQLLDRDEEGKSEYTIKADTDLRTFLEKELGKDSDGIKDGELCLPPNFYIWATMNTSDQSLFPIDSAFKRRWDWEYMPIKNEGKGYVIEINDKRYDWWQFISRINDKIGQITNSEDKKLGYWFVIPANGSTEISSKQFISKVLFYLWNDVYKNYAGSSDNIFKILDKDGNTVSASFPSFFGADADKQLQDLMAYNEIEPLKTEDGSGE